MRAACLRPLVQVEILPPSSSCCTSHFLLLSHRWRFGSSPACKRDLKKCIKNALAEAEKYKLESVAIPAISCGMFGGKPDVCIPLLVQVVIEYLQENDDCSVKEVSLRKYETHDAVLLLRGDTGRLF